MKLPRACERVVYELKSLKLNRFEIDYEPSVLIFVIRVGIMVDVLLVVTVVTIIILPLNVTGMRR